MDRHRDTFGVEPICRALQIAPSCYRLHAALQRSPELHCARTKRDQALIPRVQRVWHANWQVYGADKVWQQMNREGIRVARCTVERLMSRLGLAGARRGKGIRTTTPATSAPCPQDRVNRQFNASRPHELWVSDFTYVRTWQGWLFVAFVIDVYARRIVSWRVSHSMRTDFVLDALEQALYERQPQLSDQLVHHSDRGSQYVSNRYTERLARSWHRVFGWQPWRQLRQRPGRDHQRAVQGRVDSPPGPLEIQGIRATGHPAMGALVQQHPTARTDRVHPAGRG